MKSILYRFLGLLFLFLLFLFPCTIISASSDLSVEEEVSLLNEETLFDNEENAIKYLKQEMKSRKSTITFDYLGEHLTSEQVLNIFNEATKHTGVKDEGDYLRYHLRNYNYNYEYSYSEDVPLSSITFSFTWLSTSEMEDKVDILVSDVLDNLDVYEETEYNKIKAIYDLFRL